VPPLRPDSVVLLDPAAEPEVIRESLRKLCALEEPLARRAGLRPAAAGSTRPAPDQHTPPVVTESSPAGSPARQTTMPPAWG
jgi:hypothetical protein